MPHNDWMKTEGAPRCPATRNGHRCVYNATHVDTWASLHFNAETGFWSTPGTLEPAEDGDQPPLFSSVGDTLTECSGKLRSACERIRGLPTARRTADRLDLIIATLDDIAEEFANTDHTGGG